MSDAAKTKDANVECLIAHAIAIKRHKTRTPLVIVNEVGMRKGHRLSSVASSLSASLGVEAPRVGLEPTTK